MCRPPLWHASAPFSASPNEAASVLPLRLEPEQVLAEHAAGRIPIQADMGAGGMGVAPETLQRMIEKQALAASGEKQEIDRLRQQLHAERLVAAVAQPHIDADGFAARRRVVGFSQIAKHHQPRGVRTLTMSRNTASAPSAMPSTGATMAIGRTARNDCLYSGFACIRMPGAVAFASSAKASARWNGTNALSATMVLLPVPASPIVRQSSVMAMSAVRSRKNPGCGGPLACGIMPPRNCHWALSQPLQKPPDPETR